MPPVYEKVGVVRRMIIFLWLPLVSIPLIGNFLFIRLSNLGRTIKRFSATYKALEIIYTYSWKTTTGKGMLERVLTHILLQFMNAKAVRNRLKLVKQELRQAILSLNNQEIHIMSLGSGSARAIIEVLSEETGHNRKYTATLVDQSRSALRHSRELAEENGILPNIILVRGMLEEFTENSHNHPPDIVEMVGILDYFDKETAIRVISEIYRLLSPRGVLITCNIRTNPEKRFLTRILGWSMIYREPEELSQILLEAGFECPQIISEPLGIHILAVARKNNP